MSLCCPSEDLYCLDLAK
uniref:Uncharacterized protein n=1 Tax=Arundo donax TaxID=35708 RepID=A0A0A9QGX2_ARUDO